MERLTYNFSDIITGLSGTSRLFNKLSRGKLDAAISKLRDYEDTEEQGLLVRLPCKVGDTVYKLGYECHFGNTYSDSMDCDECEDACALMRAIVECKAPSVEWIIRNMTGKRPFAYTTREEAEAALAKEKWA